MPGSRRGKAKSPSPQFAFPTTAGLFTGLDKLGSGEATELANVYSRLHKAHAYSACRRLISIDAPIEKLRFEVVQSTVDVNRTLEEIEEQRSRVWSKTFWLSLARNVLALVPLVLTWFALSQATVAYNAELGADPSRSKYITTPFLELWQQGFNGRVPGWLTFSSVAWTDFVVLLAVFFLTFAVQVAETRRATTANAIGDDLSGALQSLAVAKKDYEDHLDITDAQSWASLVQKAITDAANITKTVAADNKATITASEEAVKQLVNGSEQFIAKLQGEVSRIIGSVDAQYTKLTQTQGEKIKLAMEAFTGANEDLIKKQMAPVVERLGDSVGAYERSARVMSQSADKLATDATTLGNAATTFGASTASVDAQLKTFNSHQDDLVAETKRAATGTQGAATHMDRVASTITSTLNPQTITLADQVVTASKAMAEVNAQLARTTVVLRNVANNLAMVGATLPPGGGDPPPPPIKPSFRWLWQRKAKPAAPPSPGAAAPGGFPPPGAPGGGPGGPI